MFRVIIHHGLADAFRLEHAVLADIHLEQIPFREKQDHCKQYEKRRRDQDRFFRLL